MRILAIRGQNIASLAERFEIDFTAEPLRSSGLFAITGPTGAGKSSILDAMCLALYGDCPRLSSGGANEDVPDAAGEAIKSRDARGVLRRGAAQGLAEVDFVALDGESYRASWSARRARGRVDGRLQGVDRGLTRLSDGQLLDGQVTAVNARVQQLSGLSYDEFRRTVLLAQGDFDAFLRADTNERAALLEKVTGTRLYRDISIRVFERTEEAKAALATLHTRRDAHQLLDDDARTALTDERATLLAEGAAARSQRGELQGALQRHSALTDAQSRLAQAETALAAARATETAAAPERALEAQIARAEPLRAHHTRLHEARAEAEAATRARALAHAAREEAAQHAAAAQAQHETALQALAEIEQRFKDFGPQWTRATQLDSQITAAETEATHAAQAAAGAVQKADAARSAADRLGQAVAAARARIAAAESARNANPALGTLARNWDHTASLLSARQLARREHDSARDSAATLKQERDTAAAALHGLAEQDSQDQAQRQSLATQAQACAGQIAALEAENPAEGAETLAARLATLATLQRASADHTTATEAAAAARTRRSQALDEATRAETAITAAEATIRDAEAVGAALAAPADQAALAVSHNAQALRLRLVPGQPCPVCGACDHPVHADAALAELAATLRADLDAANHRAATARSARTTAEGQAASARAIATQAEAALTEAGVKAAEAARQFSAARAGDDTLPASPEGALPALLAAIAQTTATRQAVLDALRRIAALRREHAQAVAARDALTEALEARAARRTALERTAAEAAQRLALAEQGASTAQSRIARLDLDLAPALAAIGARPDALDTDAEALQESLAAKVAWWGQTTADLAEGEAALAETAPQSSAAVARQAEAAAAAIEAQRALDARNAALAQLRAARAGLLGGEATDTHRSRINDQRLAAQQAEAAARQALAQAENRTALAAQTLQAAETRLADAGAGVGAAGEALDAACAEAGLEPAALAPLLARPRAETEALRARLRQIADAVTAARAACDQRRADLHAATEAGIPETPPEALQAALDALEVQHAARLERIGAITGQLAADDTARQSLAGLDAAIAEARATRDVWLAVNAAVGARQGDRFARLAQSITLDRLVARANHHLGDLKPRYRLARAGQELALHVIDRDMGDEVRSTRSLSGGERFLVSLALALALSRMSGRGGLAATLFIDEGFGALDGDSLDLAIDALETLQSQGRMVGVISHVEAMKERIPVQIRVQRQGGGRSTLQVCGGAADQAAVQASE